MMSQKNLKSRNVFDNEGHVLSETARYSGSHGVPIKFCVLLQTSLSKTQTLPLKKIYNYIPGILTALQ